MMRSVRVLFVLWVLLVVTVPSSWGAGDLGKPLHPTAKGMSSARKTAVTEQSCMVLVTIGARSTSVKVARDLPLDTLRKLVDGFGNTIAPGGKWEYYVSPRENAGAVCEIDRPHFGVLRSSNTVRIGEFMDALRAAGYEPDVHLSVPEYARSVESDHPLGVADPPRYGYMCYHPSESVRTVTVNVEISRVHALIWLLIALFPTLAVLVMLISAIRATRGKYTTAKMLAKWFGFGMPAVWITVFLVYTTRICEIPYPWVFLPNAMWFGHQSFRMVLGTCAFGSPAVIYMLGSVIRYHLTKRIVSPLDGLGISDEDARVKEIRKLRGGYVAWIIAFAVTGGWLFLAPYLHLSRPDAWSFGLLILLVVRILVERDAWSPKPRTDRWSEQETLDRLKEACAKYPGLDDVIYAKGNLEEEKNEKPTQEEQERSSKRSDLSERDLRFVTGVLTDEEVAFYIAERRARRKSGCLVEVMAAIVISTIIIGIFTTVHTLGNMSRQDLLSCGAWIVVAVVVSIWGSGRIGREEMRADCEALKATGNLDAAESCLEKMARSEMFNFSFPFTKPEKRIENLRRCEASVDGR